MKIVSPFRRSIEASLIFSLFECARALAGAPDGSVRWAGPGFDHPAESRFAAFASPTEPEIEIWVDAEVTVAWVGRMILETETAPPTVSRRCWKAEKHKRAPWSCTFTKTDLRNLKGPVTLVVEDRDGVQRLRERVPLEKLSTLLR